MNRTGTGATKDQTGDGRQKTVCRKQMSRPCLDPHLRAFKTRVCKVPGFASAWGKSSREVIGPALLHHLRSLLIQCTQERGSAGLDHRQNSGPTDQGKGGVLTAASSFSRFTDAFEVHIYGGAWISMVVADSNFNITSGYAFGTVPAYSVPDLTFKLGSI
eukprot:1136157-Pelagomonas_calceolata.AAC.6